MNDIADPLNAEPAEVSRYALSDLRARFRGSAR
jgi:hypothetical protein